MTSAESSLATPWRWLLGVGGVANLVLAAGFAFQWSWALQLWPWETGRLSFIFIGGMLAAIGAGGVWVGTSGETESLTAGFLNLSVMLAGIAAYLLVSVPEDRVLGVAIGLVALVNVGLLVRVLRLPTQRAEPVPPVLRWSYAVFAVVLLAVGLALILGVDGVMPWPVEPPTSVVFGWIFLGDAFYFAFSVWRPHWDNARAQLWSFLAYDAVLLVPLTLHLGDVESSLLPNLLAYLAVLVYSAGLGIYYVVVNRRTRGWAPLPAASVGRR
jgi:hypothetical protein